MKALLDRATIDSLKPMDKPYDVWDEDLPGFLARVRPSGTITYFVTYRYGGKRTRMKVGDTKTLTPAKARVAARKALAVVALENDPLEGRRKERKERKTTLGTFIDGVYTREGVKGHKRGQATVKSIKAAFHHLMKTPMDRITVDMIDNWRDIRKAGGLKDSSCNRYIAELRAALSFAVQKRLIDENPLAKVKMDTEKRFQRERRLSADEEVALFAALDAREADMREARRRYNQWLKEHGQLPIQDRHEVHYADHIKPMVELSLNTGMRRGEVFAMQWEDITLGERPVVHVRSESAKSGKGRTIPLNACAVETLTRWRAQTKDTGLVFPSPKTGGKIDNVNKAWANVLKRSGIEDFRWHDLRHTFASRLVQANVPLSKVQLLLGHATVVMTGRYAHLSHEDLDDTVEKLEPRATIVQFPSGRALGDKK